MKKFSAILSSVKKRKGGEAQLNRLLPTPLGQQALSCISDNRYLSQMTRCVFNAGFHWSVVSKKWPDFEKAFHGFDLAVLLTLSPDEWEQYLQDERIIRNWQKIQTVYVNAMMIDEIANEFGSFAHYFASWPVSDQIGLMKELKQRGSRLGGQTCQYFIRFIGKDGFVTSADVVAALIASGVDINAKPTSQRDLGEIQSAFNDWQDETSLPMSHISRILAFSVGDNIPVDVLLSYQGTQSVGDPLKK